MLRVHQDIFADGLHLRLGEFVILNASGFKCIGRACCQDMILADLEQRRKVKRLPPIPVRSLAMQGAADKADHIVCIFTVGFLFHRFSFLRSISFTVVYPVFLRITKVRYHYIHPLIFGGLRCKYGWSLLVDIIGGCLR